MGMIRLEPNDDEMSPWKMAGRCIVGVLVIATFVCSCSWYQAGVIKNVYSRQGIEMSQWEIFIGVKSLERTIQIKESQAK